MSKSMKNIYHFLIVCLVACASYSWTNQPIVVRSLEKTTSLNLPQNHLAMGQSIISSSKTESKANLSIIKSQAEKPGSQASDSFIHKVHFILVFLLGGLALILFGLAKNNQKRPYRTVYK
ncbi:hypothetical protein [Streptococcus catagoni]|uniref:hypothetical protein n=1 Tax=Streptococcus catagoni TaxID=2654874 RepID=UPI00140BCBFC|nr:hypothetical protein [Streptococcus catagoni]